MHQLGTSTAPVEAGGQLQATHSDAMARHPAVAPTVALIAGISVHSFLPHIPLLWITLALACVAASIIWRISQRVVVYALCGGMTFAGVAVAQIEGFQYPSNDVSAYAADQARLAQLELSIDEPPRLLTYQFTPRPLPPKQVLTARVLRVRTWTGWEVVTGGILVQISEPNPRLAQGQVVRVLGMLERPAPAMNPGQFNWAEYYRDQRILASLQILHSDNIQILSQSPLGPLQWLQREARLLLARGFEPRQSLDHALLRALLLGDTDPELSDIQEEFRKTGTSHHLAISGMHIAVLGGVVLLVCRLLRLTPRLACAIAMGFVLLYALVVLPSPPVVRSVLLSMAVCGALLLKRRGRGVQLLMLSAMAMLIYHPLDLFNAGFQLSFGTVLGLMLLGKPLAEFFNRGNDRDLAVAQNIQRPTRLQAAARWVDSQMVTTLAAGLAAWWVSMPLIARHFEQLNTWAVLGSILLAPIVFTALVGGLLKVLLTQLWPSGAWLWALGAEQPVRWMRWGVEELAKLPWADVPLPAPATLLMMAFYGFTMLGVSSRLRGGARWASRGLACLALGGILLYPFHGRVTGGTPETRDELRITLLYVGAGQCAVVEPPGGRVVLIDAGSASLVDPLHKCIAPFLRSRGITDVDTILISHANLDHFNAVAPITQAYDVREVLVAKGFVESCTGNPPAEQMLRELDDLDRPPRVVQMGDVIPLGRDTSIQALWPNGDRSLDDNNSSLVLRLTHAGKSVLFTGDIQDAAMRGLLKDPTTIHSDVLIAPHHGSSETTTPAFISAVNPSVILSSNDRSLTIKQKNLQKMIGSRTLYRTNVTGAITVYISGDGKVTAEPFLAHEPATKN
jgi:competence protein ComEC